MQVVKEKTRERLAKCAECKADYSHRSLKRNIWFNETLEKLNKFREQNGLQSPNLSDVFGAKFMPLYDPYQAKLGFRALQKEKHPGLF